MLRIIIGFLTGMVMYVAACNGEWGTFAVFAAIGLFLILGLTFSAWDNRAWVNRQEYWAMSGKERVMARHRWEAEAREEEERERQRACEKALRKQQRYAPQAAVNPIVQASARKKIETRFCCPRCSKAIKARCEIAHENRQHVRHCKCPNCGNDFQVKFVA